MCMHSCLTQERLRASGTSFWCTKDSWTGPVGRAFTTFSRRTANGRLIVAMEFSRETVRNSFEVQHRPIGGEVMVPRILVAAFALALALVPLRAWAQLPPHIGVQGQMAPPAPASMATEQERAILLEFFKATGGARWKQTHGWNTASDPCEWQGVFCLPVRRGRPATLGADGTGADRQRADRGRTTFAVPASALETAIPRGESDHRGAAGGFRARRRQPSRTVADGQSHA